METLSVTIPRDLKERLDALAEGIGKPVDECLRLAVAEFVENWEAHQSDIHQITGNEARAVLSAAAND